MKRLIAALILAVPFLAGSAYAADTAAKKEPTAQQTKMKQCNADAKGKKGDERKAFMKECLSKDGAPSAEAPKKKMTPGECSAKNKGLKGDEFKKAQSECMKG